MIYTIEQITYNTESFTTFRIEIGTINIYIVILKCYSIGIIDNVKKAGSHTSKIKTKSKDKAHANKNTDPLE